MRQGYTMIPKAILDKRLSIEAIGLYTWLSANADKKGRVTTSRADLSKRTGLSQRQVRTAIEKLEATKLVTKVATKGTTKVATILTVLFLASYETKQKSTDQSCDQSCDQTSDQPRAYKNEILFNHSIEEEKEEKKPTTIVVGKEKPDVAPATTLSTGLSIEERQVRFYDTLRPYVSKYSAEMLRAFYDYWSEPNRSMTKMRMELEKTWSLSMRLATWHKRDEEHKFKNGKYNRPDSTAETVDAAAAAVAELIAANR